MSYERCASSSRVTRKYSRRTSIFSKTRTRTYASNLKTWRRRCLSRCSRQRRSRPNWEFCAMKENNSSKWTSEWRYKRKSLAWSCETSRKLCKRRTHQKRRVWKQKFHQRTQSPVETSNSQEACSWVSWKTTCPRSGPGMTRSGSTRLRATQSQTFSRQGRQTT